MELNQVLTFIRVVEMGSFSRAAENLDVTQPTLSARMQTLERDVGQRLFERIGRGVRLTEAGRAFLPFAERSLAILQEGREAIAASQNPSIGRLRIGTARIIGSYVLPDILAHFREEYPGVEVAILTGRSHEVLQMILDEEVQVGLGRTLVHPEIDSTYLYDEEVVFVTYPLHPFATRSTVSISEIAQEPLILYDKDSTYYVLITRECREAGIMPRVIMNLDSVEATKKMIERGLGVSFLPVSAISSELEQGTLVYVPLAEGHRVTLPTSVMVRKSSIPHPLVDAFLSVVQRFRPTGLSSRAGVSKRI
ncbi:MAG TPA: LysR family transcriptional regulator [Dehalococcoidia bacterium]|nr:LysR family transcriptional regulator [Dehalococcoidia bacterium]